MNGKEIVKKICTPDKFIDDKWNLSRDRKLIPPSIELELIWIGFFYRRVKKWIENKFVVKYQTVKQFIQFLIINAYVYIYVRNIYRGYNIQQSLYRSRIGALILHYISCDKNYVINRQATYELVIKLVKLPVSLDPCFQNTFSRQCSSRVSKKFPPLPRHFVLDTC